MLGKFYKKIQNNKEHTFFYMLFLRLTPLVPNWFVNIGSPIVGIPIRNFFLGTLFGKNTSKQSLKTVELKNSLFLKK